MPDCSVFKTENILFHSSGEGREAAQWLDQLSDPRGGLPVPPAGPEGCGSEPEGAASQGPGGHSTGTGEEECYTDTTAQL